MLEIKDNAYDEYLKLKDIKEISTETWHKSSEHVHSIIDSDDDIYIYDLENEAIKNVNIKLFDYILKRFEGEMNNIEEKFKEVIELFKQETRDDCYKIELLNGEPFILDDKLGGKPYLPIGEEYPKEKDGNNLALLLQVNLKNVELNGYPKKGILEIFTDSKVDYPCQYVIKYFDDDLDYQINLPEVDMSNYIVNKSYKISLIKDVCYMPINDFRFIKIFTSIVNKVFDTSLKNYGDLDDFFVILPGMINFVMDMKIIQ